VYELCLAEVAVPTAATTPGTITDARLDANLCGTVNSLISAVYE